MSCLQYSAQPASMRCASGDAMSESKEAPGDACSGRTAARRPAACQCQLLLHDIDGIWLVRGAQKRFRQAQKRYTCGRIKSYSCQRLHQQVRLGIAAIANDQVSRMVCYRAAILRRQLQLTQQLRDEIVLVGPVRISNCMPKLPQAAGPPAMIELLLDRRNCLGHSAMLRARNPYI